MLTIRSGSRDPRTRSHIAQEPRQHTNCNGVHTNQLVYEQRTGKPLVRESLTNPSRDSWEVIGMGGLTPHTSNAHSTAVRKTCS